MTEIQIYSIISFSGGFLAAYSIAYYRGYAAAIKYLTNAMEEELRERW